MSRQRPRRWRALPLAKSGAGDWLYLMAVVDKWCMVRHPRAVPFAISLKEWEAMPLAPDPSDRDPILPVPEST